MSYLEEAFESLSVNNNDPISILGDLKADVDGSTMPIKAVGTLSKRSAQIIAISLYDDSVMNF